MMFVDPLNDSTADTTGLQTLLAAWGVQMPANKVLADNLYATPVVVTSDQPPVRHPGALTLPREAMAQQDVSTWGVDSVTLLNPGTLVPLKKSRTTFTPLLQSSGQSSTFDGVRFTQPDEFASMIGEAVSRGRPNVIAARIEGPAYSAFPDASNGQKATLQKATNIHVVVIADIDMLSDRVWLAARNANGQKAQRPGNARFVLNTLDNLAAPDTLSAISPRASDRQQPGLLDRLRHEAAQSYRKKAALMEQRLAQTEKEWRLLNTPSSMLETQAISSNTLLQALNKERLRLRMELHTLEKETYKSVRRLELAVVVLTTITVPLIVSLLGLGIFISRLRRQHPPAAAFY
jgi:ABC-type uncharacterized transport system involved in gliding motility auxiliary subunit